MNRGLLLLLLWCIPAAATVIDPTNRIDWTVGTTVGVRGGMVTRTNLIDVTAAPYNVDNTGAANAVTGIEAAIAAASTNDVVYLPAGTYDITAGLTFKKSGVTLRGAGTNTLLVGHVTFGQWNSGGASFTAVSGGAKGSTNVELSSITGEYGAPIEVGDLLLVSDGWGDDTDSLFQYISVSGYDALITQVVVVESLTGSNVVLWPPMVWNFTNSATYNPMQYCGIAAFKPARFSGMEHLTLLGTNGALNDAETTLLSMHMLRDCWLYDVNVFFPNNYAVDVSYCQGCQVDSCHIGKSRGAGTSHSGFLTSLATGCLFQNNIIESVQQCGFMFNNGFSGNAIFGNYFVDGGGTGDVTCHNTHPVMNLWEANQFTTFFEMDGYFGSASHQTLFRNRLNNGTLFKRFITYMQTVGNVCGNTNAAWVYNRTESGYTAPLGVFEFGFPNIGNRGYVDVSGPVGWNYPGDYVGGFDGETFTNGIFTITNTQVATSNLVGMFTNIPAPVGSGYALKFQDATNPLKFWPDNGTVILSTSSGTESNLALNVAITVTNGWKVFIAGQNAYQHLQTSNVLTHNLHGNLVYTNGVGQEGTVVWDAGNADHVVPASLLYASAPSWWGTNRWPAIDPTNAVPVAPIPAELRYAGVDSGETPESPATPAVSTRTHTISGTINIGTLRRAQ